LELWNYRKSNKNQSKKLNKPKQLTKPNEPKKPKQLNKLNKLKEPTTTIVMFYLMTEKANDEMDQSDIKNPVNQINSIRGRGLT